MDRSKPAEIAERLRSLLNRDAGLTQAALARFCDVSSAAVAKWCYQGVISPQNLMQAKKKIASRCALACLKKKRPRQE